LSNTLPLVYKIIEEPTLIHVVQHLNTNQFCKLIKHVGVEDAGELLSLATSKQLTNIFDESFWKNIAPGKVEEFDPEEFGLWLEVIHEYSRSEAITYINNMEDDFLTLGLASHLLVVDYESLAVRIENTHHSFEDELLDKVLDSERMLEWGDVLLISKGSSFWDTLVDLITELDNYDHDRINRILDRINHISTEYIEDNGGLYNVLTSGKMLETDLAADREARREKQGYVSPEAASAFLKLAQETSADDILSSKEKDYLTKAYFSAYQPSNQATETESPIIKLKKTLSEKFPDIYKEFVEASIISKDPLRFLPDVTPTDSYTLFSLALQAIEESHPERFTLCIQDLGYLINVLIAGTGSKKNKRLQPAEAAQKVIHFCHTGLDILCQNPANEPESIKVILLEESLIKLFRLGWNNIMKPRQSTEKVNKKNITNKDRLRE